MEPLDSVPKLAAEKKAPEQFKTRAGGVMHFPPKTLVECTDKRVFQVSATGSYQRMDGEMALKKALRDQSKSPRQRKKLLREMRRKAKKA